MSVSQLPSVDRASLIRRRSAKWSAYPDDVLAAWVAEMDFALAPPIAEVLTDAIAIGDAGYAHPDSSSLPDDLAGFAARRMGWTIDPGQVVAVGDVVSGLAELVGALTEPGDGVVINPPVYHPFFSVIGEAGREVVEVGLAPDGGLDLEAIADAFAGGARAMLLCSPHNPTGRVVPADEQRALAALAREHGAWILADEIHAPLAGPAAGHVPFLELGTDARERGILLTSASKAFNLAGLDCAQIVTASPSARRGVEGIRSLARHPGHLGVLAAEVAYSSCDVWLDGVIETIESNAVLAGELLAERLPEVGYQPPQAGYLAWLDLSALELGPDPAPALLERGRIALSPGPQFGRGGEDHVRLNIGTSPELVEEAIERIARAVGR